MPSPGDGKSSIGVLSGSPDLLDFFLKLIWRFRLRLSTAGFYVNKADKDVVELVNSEHETNLQARFNLHFFHCIECFQPNPHPEFS